MDNRNKQQTHEQESKEINQQSLINVQTFQKDKSASNLLASKNKVVEYTNLQDASLGAISEFRLFPENNESLCLDNEPEENNEDGAKILIAKLGEACQSRENYMTKQTNTMPAHQAHSDCQMDSGQSLTSSFKSYKQGGFSRYDLLQRQQFSPTRAAQSSTKKLQDLGLMNQLSSQRSQYSMLYPGMGTPVQSNILNEDEVILVQQEFRAQQRDHEKKEALYQQKIQLLELEMKDLQERQTYMSRINEKLMKVFDNKKKNTCSKSKSKANNSRMQDSQNEISETCRSETKSVDSSVLAKIDQIMASDHNQLLQVRYKLRESEQKTKLRKQQDIARKETEVNSEVGNDEVAEVESVKDEESEKNQVSSNAYVQNLNKSLELPMKAFDSNQEINYTLKSEIEEDARDDLNSEHTATQGGSEQEPISQSMQNYQTSDDEIDLNRQQQDNHHSQMILLDSQKAQRHLADDDVQNEYEDQAVDHNQIDLQSYKQIDSNQEQEDSQPYQHQTQKRTHRVQKSINGNTQIIFKMSGKHISESSSHFNSTTANVYQQNFDVEPFDRTKDQQNSRSIGQHEEYGAQQQYQQQNQNYLMAMQNIAEKEARSTNNGDQQHRNQHAQPHLQQQQRQSGTQQQAMWEHQQVQQEQNLAQPQQFQHIQQQYQQQPQPWTQYHQHQSQQQYQPQYQQIPHQMQQTSHAQSQQQHQFSQDHTSNMNQQQFHGPPTLEEVTAPCNQSNSYVDGIYSQQMMIQNSSISEQNNNSSFNNQTINQSHFSDQESLQMVPLKLVQQELATFTNIHRQQQMQKDSEISNQQEQIQMLQNQLQFTTSQKDQCKQTILNLQQLIEQIILECNEKTSYFENEMQLQKSQLENENYLNSLDHEKHQEMEENLKQIQENLESQVENLTIQIQEKQLTIEKKNKTIREQDKWAEEQSRAYADLPKFEQKLTALVKQTENYMRRDRLSFNDRYEVIILSEYELNELNSDLKDLEDGLCRFNKQNQRSEISKLKKKIGSSAFNKPMNDQKSHNLNIDGQRDLHTRSKSSMTVSKKSEMISKGGDFNKAEEFRRLVMQINFLREQLDVAIFKVRAIKVAATNNNSFTRKSRQNSQDEQLQRSFEHKHNLRQQDRSIQNLQQMLFNNSRDKIKNRKSQSKDSQRGLVQQLERHENELTAEIETIEDALKGLKQFKINQRQSLQSRINSEISLSPDRSRTSEQRDSRKQENSKRKLRPRNSSNLNSPVSQTPLQEAPVNQPKSSLKISDSQAQLQNLFTQRTNALNEMQRTRSARSGETRNDAMRKTSQSVSQSRKQHINSPTCPKIKEFTVSTHGEQEFRGNDMYGKKLAETSGIIVNKYIRDFNNKLEQLSDQTLKLYGDTTEQTKNSGGPSQNDIGMSVNEFNQQLQNAAINFNSKHADEKETSQVQRPARQQLLESQMVAMQKSMARSTKQIPLLFLRSSGSTTGVLSTARLSRDLGSGRLRDDLSPERLVQDSELHKPTAHRKSSRRQESQATHALRESRESWQAARSGKQPQNLHSQQIQRQIETNGQKHKFQPKRTGSGGGAVRTKSKNQSMGNLRCCTPGLPGQTVVGGNSSSYFKKSDLQVLQDARDGDSANRGSRLKHKKSQPTLLKHNHQPHKQSFKFFKENKENPRFAQTQRLSVDLAEKNEEQSHKGQEHQKIAPSEPSQGSEATLAGVGRDFGLERLPSHQEQIEQARQRRSRSRFNRTATSYQQICQPQQIPHNQDQHYDQQQIHNNYYNNPQLIGGPEFAANERSSHTQSHYSHLNMLNSSDGGYLLGSMCGQHTHANSINPQVATGSNGCNYFQQQPQAMPNLQTKGQYQQMNQPMRQTFNQQQNMGYPVYQRPIHPQALAKNARQSLDSLCENPDIYQQVNPGAMNQYYPQNSSQQHQQQEYKSNKRHMETGAQHIEKPSQELSSSHPSHAQSVVYHGSSQQYSPVNNEIADIQIDRPQSNEVLAQSVVSYGQMQNPCSYIVNYKGTGSGQLISKAGSGLATNTYGSASASHSRRSSTITLGGAGGGAFGMGTQAHVSLMQSQCSLNTGTGAHNSRQPDSSGPRAPDIQYTYSNAQPKQSYYDPSNFGHNRQERQQELNNSRYGN